VEHSPVGKAIVIRRMDELNRVRLAVLRHTIETTRVPSASELAAELAIPASQVTAAYRALADAHVYVLDRGDPTRLRMANPFSAVATPFRVRVRERGYFGNCVWDSLGIVSLQGGDGSVETSCPDCAQAMTLRVAGGRLIEAEGVVNFSVPARQWWDDIIYT
jgi:Alkylmercury lyase